MPYRRKDRAPTDSDESESDESVDADDFESDSDEDDEDLSSSDGDEKTEKKVVVALEATENEDNDNTSENSDQDRHSGGKLGEEWLSSDEEEEEEPLKKGSKSFVGKDKDSDDEVDEDNEEIEEDFTDRTREAMETFELPTDELEAESQDPKVLSQRIKEMIGILSNFKEYQAQIKHNGQNRDDADEENRSNKVRSLTSRSAFIDQLTKDCAAYYGYLPSLIELFLSLFSPAEMVEFLEANETARPTVIRTNTLRTRRKELAEQLISRGVSLAPLADWSKVGIKVFESNVPIGATPEYLAGHYMLQSASSFTPVLALDPQPNERILDMASAPGGKTSYICQLMQNTGLIIANDSNEKRMKATIANCSRLGCSNIIHVNHDGRDFPKVMGGFDRVMLDAPCSGLGVISRDFSVKLQRTNEDIYKNSTLQRQLILSAIDSCNHRSKTGGFVVYSTCSVSIEENEMVVQYALENRDVKIVDSGLTFGRTGLTKYKERHFHPNMKLCRRMYPHVNNMDGFFVCKLKKCGPKSEEDVTIAYGKLSKKQKKKRKLADVSKEGEGEGVEKEEKEEEENESSDNNKNSSKKKHKHSKKSKKNKEPVSA